MARVVRFNEMGGPEVLRIEEHAVRLPEPDEVRIKVKALGLNRAEALLRRGLYIETPPLPSGLGLEAAGIVEMVGNAVEGIEPGDIVSIIPSPSMVRWPAYGELAVFPARLVVKHPPSLTWETATAVWMQYLTAYGALLDIAQLKRGDFVVITAASSSVGLAAIQVANSVGAIPIAVTRTCAKQQALLAAGAAHVVVTEESDLAAELARITGAKGVRVVFDPIAGPIVEVLTAAMSHGGILIGYGNLSPEPTPYPLEHVLPKGLTLRGYVVHETIGDPVKLHAAKAFILDGLASGALQPIIAKTFPFEQIVQAHQYMESNEQFGKIVVTL
ncbi:NADPH:quinone reductase [Chania multitudinisentens RB-25]|uniref:NADPH:quinone reductase n=1 Tax=Chania multitudinisentens RB-25 TaxID=1441930 RepID=W0L9G8_9GAMM|nr:zinc-dependent alcohol dehydrogenase family protein [Chania multitudinisentens]AHG18660.1 NADPH:quinone reductase [Chania multitudinisentens RB-25]